MRKPSCASADHEHTAHSTQRYALSAVCCLLIAGCAAPSYAVRQTPVPQETPEVIQIERTISAIQAEAFTRQGARPIGRDEHLRGLAVQDIVDRLSRVTERPALRYRAYLYHERDPNAASLADGRVYLSTAMIAYLASRGSRADELAFIIAHELAHTVAQHLVKRYRMLRQQQLLLSLVAAGAAAATLHAGAAAQQAGKLAVDAAGLLQDVATSGYSQEQELEADQLGIRYVTRGGFEPKAALDLLRDFERFENPWPFLRTHPYMELRQAYVQRYLEEPGLREGLPASRAQVGVVLSTPAPPSGSPGVEEKLRRLRQVQRLYPEGSISWTNLQREIEALEQL